MSDLDLGALKALAEAANSGPWRSRDNLDVYAPSLRELPSGETQDDTICQTLEANDAEFIAAANPEAVLALIERVQAAEAERDEWEYAVSDGVKGPLVPTSNVVDYEPGYAEGLTRLRRRKAVPAGPWEPVPDTEWGEA